MIDHLHFMLLDTQVSQSNRIINFGILCDLFVFWFLLSSVLLCGFMAYLSNLFYCHQNGLGSPPVMLMTCSGHSVDCFLISGFLKMSLVHVKSYFHI